MSFLGMFIQFVLIIVFTVTLFYQLAELPGLWFGWLMLCLLLLVLAVLWWLKLAKEALFTSINAQVKTLCYSIKLNYLLNLLLAFIIGLNLVFWQAFFAAKVDSQFFNKMVQIHGKVIGLPEVTQTSSLYKISFLLDVSHIESDYFARDFWLVNQPKIKLNWYLKPNEFSQLKFLPETAQSWQFRAKLKVNHAAMNLGGRDYEAWLFQQHISAKGYVSGLRQRESQAPHSFLVEPSNVYDWRTWRFTLSQKLEALFKESEFESIYRALLVGDKSLMKAQQWQVLQSSGTVHLMAISGLHMAIVAALGFWFFRILWWLGLYRINRFNRPMLSAFGGVLFATAYLLVSGAAIPTQRAWIMVVTVLGFLWVQRKFQPWSALAMAGLLVLLWDSRAVLSQGFWLSFIAVALIFVSLKLLKGRNKWQQLLFVQLVLTVGLAPLILWHFYTVPIYGFLANLIAVPFVSFIGLPLLFIQLIIGLLSESLASYSLAVVDLFWRILWDILVWLNQLPNINVATVAHSKLWLVLVSAGLVVLLKIALFKAPLNNKKLSIFIGFLMLYFVILLFYPYEVERPENNADSKAWLTVLDVGQGQSVVLETKSHLLVYDTGARWGAKTDAAKVALLPYLKSRSWQAIDILMVSHSDNDHSGGSLSVLEDIAVKERVSGQAHKLNKLLSEQVSEKNLQQTVSNSSFKSKVKTMQNIEFSRCYSGQTWLFDGVKIEVLSPFKNPQFQMPKNDNDQSCVLKISYNNQSILITGDLSDKGEALLMQNYSKTDLQAQLLIAGHHGSKSSTSMAWLNTLDPEMVVFSSGYLNRYRFPATKTLQRLQQFSENRSLYQSRALNWWNTACSGALSFSLNRSSIKLRYQARNHLRKWYHHSCLPSQQGVYFQ